MPPPATPNVYSGGVVLPPAEMLIMSLPAIDLQEEAPSLAERFLEWRPGGVSLNTFADAAVPVLVADPVPLADAYATAPAPTRTSALVLASLRAFVGRHDHLWSSGERRRCAGRSSRGGHDVLHLRCTAGCAAMLLCSVAICVSAWTRSVPARTSIK